MAEPDETYERKRVVGDDREAGPERSGLGTDLRPFVYGLGLPERRDRVIKDVIVFARLTGESDGDMPG